MPITVGSGTMKTCSIEGIPKARPQQVVQAPDQLVVEGADIARVAQHLELSEWSCQ